MNFKFSTSCHAFKGSIITTLRTIMSTKMTEGTPIRDLMILMITLFNKMEIFGDEIDRKT